MRLVSFYLRGHVLASHVPPRKGFIVLYTGALWVLSSLARLDCLNNDLVWCRLSIFLTVGRAIKGSDCMHFDSSFVL